MCVGNEKDSELKACVLRHLYASNRIRGPVIIVCSLEDKELWEMALHTFTQLKVAVMSGMW